MIIIVVGWVASGIPIKYTVTVDYSHSHGYLVVIQQVMIPNTVNSYSKCGIKMTIVIEGKVFCQNYRTSGLDF